MLKLELIDEHGVPRIVTASRVVVRDQPTNTPIAVAVALLPTPGAYLVSSSTDKDFEQILKQLRINDTVIVDRRSKHDLSFLPTIQ